MRERVPVEEFVLPYGKYKGIKLGDLYYKDKPYLVWCKKNFTDNVGERITEFLENMATLESGLGLDVAPTICQSELDF